MLEKLIEKVKEKYNLEIETKIKFMNVYTITFKLEGKEISFVYMYDNLSSFETNLKELSHKINEEIIYFYLKKGEKI